LYELPKKYFSTFDFIIGDEAHTFQAKSLTQIMTKLTNCDYRIGMTGTLHDSKVNKLVLEGLFGPAKKVVSTKELIDRGQLANFSIKSIVLQYNENICKELSGKTYQEEIDFIVQHEPRNNFIKNLTLNLKGNSLILFNYVEKHGKVLHNLIQEQASEGRKIFFVHGEVDVMDRELVRAITETEQDAIIVASYGTFSTGINIRNLHNIIFASPTKSKIRTLQSIGRGLRLGDNKDKAVLYDIADDLRYKGKSNYTLKHFEERVKFYNEEKFSFSTTTKGI
jgi:superfamily II DNA or RNA helicase